MLPKTVNITLIFILIITIEIECRWSGYDCADCHKESIGTCEIEVDPGFSCGEYKIRKRPRRWGSLFYRSLNTLERLAHDSDAEIPQVTQDLSVCVPSSLNQTDQDIVEGYPICCVWSKELGCQILVADDNDLWDCGICRQPMHITYDNLKPCPCEDEVDDLFSLSGNGNRSKLNFVIAVFWLFSLFKL